MTAAELLLSDGVVAFFIVVALCTASVGFLLQLSTFAVLCLALLAEIWMVLAWCGLAASCETVWELPAVMVNIQFSLARAGMGIVSRGFRPRFPQWTVSFEFVRAILIGMRGGKFGYNLVKRRNAQYFRQQGEIIGTIKGTKACRQFGTMVNPVMLNGLEHLWIRPKSDTRSKTRLVLLYYHGGGYVLFGPRFYVDLGNRLRAEILTKLQQLDSKRMENVTVEVLLANYRKSPEHHFPVPEEDALSMYKYLLEQEGVPANHVILGGDSAGGGLVMSTLLRIRDETNLPQPTAAILACPFVDLAEDPSADKARDRNCILPVTLLDAFIHTFHPTPADPKTWKDAASVYCDLHSLPPTYIQTGTCDTIHQDAVKLYAKAQADGLTTWEYDAFENMPHAFIVVPAETLPEVHRGVDHAAEFAARQWVKQL
ncbi:hypothetical protein Poli38472_004443 [Pythium oligandrum]|uniref:Alpha/beta hydrolase fold-3 domain-containing protein n=1 Tax=Pythium oligandrum TaxID=41045 RepID=A0A8K1CAB0_PYTOL|nr:hypothetical protein Poli38472_004443 [Pythium oligandrum]|eukprot:TMW59374.1 hypothetical protein Poli38472_004443 [Pythium oligandrum]